MHQGLANHQATVPVPTQSLQSICSVPEGTLCINSGSFCQIQIDFIGKSNFLRSGPPSSVRVWDVGGRPIEKRSLNRFLIGQETWLSRLRQKVDFFTKRRKNIDCGSCEAEKIRILRGFGFFPLQNPRTCGRGVDTFKVEC